jgi:hypothetical protein
MESHIFLAYGKYKGSVHLGYSDIYFALNLEVGSDLWDESWQILSKHRKRRSAEKACENHEQESIGGTSKATRPGTGRGARRKSI